MPPGARRLPPRSPTRLPDLHGDDGIRGGGEALDVSVGPQVSARRGTPGSCPMTSNVRALAGAKTLDRLEDVEGRSAVDVVEVRGRCDAVVRASRVRVTTNTTRRRRRSPSSAIQRPASAASRRPRSASGRPWSPTPWIARISHARIRTRVRGGSRQGCARSRSGRSRMGRNVRVGEAIRRHRHRLAGRRRARAASSTAQPCGRAYLGPAPLAVFSALLISLGGRALRGNARRGRVARSPQALVGWRGNVALCGFSFCRRRPAGFGSILLA